LANNIVYQTIREQPVITGHGTLVDLSECGCRVSGYTRLREGVHIQLALHGEGGQVSTILSNCEVMWVKEYEFGVRFLWEVHTSANQADSGDRGRGVVMTTRTSNENHFRAGRSSLSSISPLERSTSSRSIRMSG
jgi:hypothetical protein